MKRPVQNLVVDSIAFVLFVVLVATGLLMYVNLPPGSHGWAIWGLGRHDWGAIHFWVAVGMLAVMAVHLLLHWRWIVSMVKGRPAKGPRARHRIALALVGVGALLILAAAPLVTPKQAVHEVETYGREAAAHAVGSGAADAIRGSMSLYEVEAATGVPVAYLVHELDLPVRTSSDLPLRDLARRYGFAVDDVRRLVQDAAP